MIQGHKSRFLLPLLLILACLVFVFEIRARASAEDQMDAAVEASKAWIAEIDNGKYEDSYDFACDETRGKFPEDHWVDVLKAIRKQWGTVIKRQQLSHVYKPNGVPGLNGECVVVTYNTDFQNLTNATETVTLVWQDGKWRGAGYLAGPTPDPNAPPIVPGNTTEVHTEPHVTPQAQSP